MALDSVAKQKIAAVKVKTQNKAMSKIAKMKRNQAKRLRLQRKMGVILGIGGTLVVAGSAAVMIFPVVDYVKGRLAFMKKDYTEAEHLFAQCGNFLDSEACRREALYWYGTQCYATKEYQDACNAFAECGDYGDCAQRIEEMRKMGLAE